MHYVYTVNNIGFENLVYFTSKLTALTPLTLHLHHLHHLHLILNCIIIKIAIQHNRGIHV